MQMSDVITAVNRAAADEQKELDLLVAIKASNDDLTAKLNAALNSGNVSDALASAITAIGAESDLVEQKIVALSANTGTGNTGTSTDGTGAGGIAPGSTTTVAPAGT